MAHRIKTISILLILSGPLYAQDYNNAISTNIFGIARRAIGTELYRSNINYERSILNSFSFLFDIEQGRYMTGYGEDNQGFTEEYEQTGFGITVEGRFYPIISAYNSPKGFFLGFFYKRYSINEIYKGGYNGEMKTLVNEIHTVTGIGCDLGYKFGINRFMIEPVVGTSLASSHDGLGTNPIMKGRYTSEETWMYFVRLECKLGILF